MSETDAGVGRNAASPRRVVVYGVTGQLGQELVGRLDESDWPIAELVGVASPNSVGNTFEFRGEDHDIVGEPPLLKGFDLVFICTRGVQALEIVRDCLRAEVPCLDLTGSLSNQAEVPMPVFFGPMGSGDAKGETTAGSAEAVMTAPLLGLPSPTTIVWASVLSAIAESVEVTRVMGTVLCSASASGQRGLVALSEESIALFNQSEPPPPGPAGQGVAFDVIPGGGIDCSRVRGELIRIFGDALRIDVASLQVPTFVGEGTSLSIELASPLDRTALEARLASRAGLSVVAEGLGSRGLAPVEEKSTEPMGPTLRDVAGVDEVLVGRIEADASARVDQGWRLWLASDPLRLAAGHAVRVAARRLGLD